MKTELTVARLRELLDYDAKTGDFTWRASRGTVRAGSLAGSPNTQGYVSIQIDGRLHRAHRLAWLHFYGSWPVGELDHVNQVKADNSIANLRQVTSAQNKQNKPMQRNNSSGLRGVSRHRPNGRWRAQISHNRKVIYLGLFDTAEAAFDAYKAAAAQLHTHNPEVA